MEIKEANYEVKLRSESIKATLISKICLFFKKGYQKPLEKSFTKEKKLKIKLNKLHRY